MSDKKSGKGGPAVQPLSPNKASRAKSAVEPPKWVCAALLKTPGHITLTEKPHNAQAISDINGTSDIDAIIYETKHAAAHTKKHTVNLKLFAVQAEQHSAHAHKQSKHARSHNIPP